MPEINIEFKQLAATAVTRSQRGVFAVVLHDATKEDWDKVVYDREADIEAERFTQENAALLKSAFLGQPHKVWVVRLDNEQDFSQAAAVLDGIAFDWMCYAAEEGQEDAVSYIKDRNSRSKNRPVCGVVAGVEADDKGIVNFANSWVMTKEGETLEGWQYAPRLAGLLAGLPLTRSSTYYVLTDLTDVAPIEDLNAAISKGQFCLFRDEEEIRVARGVNSLTTLGTTDTEDMKKITVVETMNLIKKDIGTEYKNNYIGRYKNTYDRQCLLMSAINGYFRELAEDEILDRNYQNTAFVNVEEQRSAWIQKGKAEAADWDENTVKKNTFGSKIFLAGNLKILDAVEDLQFIATLE